MFRLNAVRIGFLMGISLLLAAIIYFFAANWSGLGRADKLLASAGIIVLFYGASYIFSKMKFMLGHHAFLSSSLLVGGCISFGAAVALLNQIYNSHADTYELFLVWSIPALLFSFITRSGAFYILTYILGHLALWQYFFPTSLTIRYSEEQLLFIGGLFVLINLLLFMITEARWIKSTALQIASFILFHSSLLIMSVSFQLDVYSVWLNLACAAAIAFGFYYFIRIRLHKTMLTLNALAASAFAVFKFFELLSEHASTAFFIYGLIFVAALLTGNILFFRYLNRLGQDKTEGEPQQDEDAHRGALIGKVVSTIVTVVGILIGSISLIGLVLLASKAFEPEVMLYALSLIFIIPVVILSKINQTVRYTLLAIGFAAGIAAIIQIDKTLPTLLFLIVAITGWFRLQGRAQHLFIYSLINIIAGIGLFQMLQLTEQSLTIVVLLLTMLNALVFASHFLLPETPMRKHVRECGLIFAMLFLFWLTFMDDLFTNSNLLFNIANFIIITYLAFYFVRRNQAVEATVSLTFWFIYIAFKYYDLLWTLLHKSITLAILGVIIMAVTYILAFRARAAVPEDTQRKNLFIRKGPVLIFIVVVLQLGYIGYHAYASEALLSNGAVVKLQIEPLDPRSLLQGDYVTLNYTISTPPPSVEQELESHEGLTRVKVVLQPNGQGIYEFNRLYNKGDELSAGEIIINGRVSGWRSIYYGIETFFVPEGTGTEVEQNASFAYVRVSAHGDALLERLSRD